jgi:signal transduction histidine kinase
MKDPENRRAPFSLTLVAVILVALIGSLAGGTLWAVRRTHAQAAHSDAALAVVLEGQRIVARLARHTDVVHGEEDGAAWKRLSELAHSLYDLQGGLQYVSVVRDGVTVYHEQVARSTNTPPEAAAAEPGETRITRRVLSLDGAAVPVVVFSAPFTSEDGKPGQVDIALRAETVGHEEQAAKSAVTSMFRLSLATVLVSFAVCAGVVVWSLRREARREQQRRQEEHLAFSGMLANGIAHDFRNPMSSLRLDVQMLQKEATKPEPGAEKLRSLADRIRHTLDRMDKVFQEFLYLSRPASERAEAVDVAASVREALGMLAARFESAGVRLDLRMEEPLRAQAYPGALRRALVNVLTNAEQFSGPGGAVTVTAGREGAEAVIDVRDTGPGIPKSERRRVFDMFVTTRPGGTGLGLFLARAAIERCGGTILAMDPDGPGAWIRVRLPLIRDGQADLGAPEAGKMEDSPS